MTITRTSASWVGLVVLFAASAAAIERAMPGGKTVQGEDAGDHGCAGPGLVVRPA